MAAMAVLYGLPAIPARLVAGDFLTWERPLSEFPAADGWDLLYALSTPTTAIQLNDTVAGVSIADGGAGSWVVEIEASVTAAWAVSGYGYQEYVQKAGGAERRTLVPAGRLEVVANLAAGAADLRSHARTMVEALEAYFEGKATQQQLDVLSYSIASRSMQRRDFDEMNRILEHYRKQLAAEEAAARVAAGGRGNRIALGRFV